jgi:hypothetical protein
MARVYTLARYVVLLSVLTHSQKMTRLLVRFAQTRVLVKVL